MHIITKHKMEWGLLFLGVLLLINTLIAEWAYAYAADPVGTAFMPRLYIFFLIGSTALKLFFDLKKGHEGEEKLNIDITPKELKDGMVLILYAATMLFFIYIAHQLGVVVTIFVFLIGWFLAFGLEKKQALILAVSGTAVVYFLLIEIAEVWFPEGLLF